MCTLPTLHPTVYQEFLAGKFVGQKTGRLFSSIALDQMHEQLNAVLKGDGGITGLTEHAAQLMKHMVIGPEYSQLIQEFESSTKDDLKHHEQYEMFQKSYKKDVDALITALIDLGNPFEEDNGQLLDLESTRIMRKEQYQDFFDEWVLIHGKV